MVAAIVLGFGSRAPSKVLELLSAVVAQGAVASIVPQRSSSMELALLKAPHRTFLSSNDAAFTNTNSKRELWVYCLPPTRADHLQFVGETNRVREACLNPNAVVLVYDSQTHHFVGVPNVTVERVVLAMTSEKEEEAASLAQEWARGALGKLAERDQASLERGRTGDGIVIVVGSGGREHALAVALASSPLVQNVICCPGNGGTAAESRKIRNVPPASGMDLNGFVVQLAQEEKADLVVIGPEDPLVKGMVDELQAFCPNVKAFGPTKAASILEASKAFTKDFLQDHGIPTASYRTFTDVAQALAYVESLDESDRQVVKASGLAAGKGVLLPTTKAETRDAVRQIMEDKAFGNAGDECVVESFLTGPEASCLAFCDGKTAVLMPASQDHKRALDGDQGLNTGGMGAYAPAPCVTPALQAQIQEFCITTVQKMAQRGTPYVGILYAGMMLTPDGPKVLEFNCRFGDPETQVVLPLLETDLYEVMCACCDGTLDQMDVRFKENTSAATVVCAAKGYPSSYPKGMLITGLEAAGAIQGVKVYHAGTEQTDDDDGSLVCSGGRVLAVTGTGSTLAEALRTAYRGVSQVDFVGETAGESLLHRRTDIGRQAVQKKLRLCMLGSTRGTASVPLTQACAAGTLEAEVVAVLSNKSAAPILDKGRALGKEVTTQFLSSKGLTRSQYDAECTAVLVDAGVDLVLLIGYMRILSKGFTDFWAKRCLNVHPSLLPKHAGGMDLQVHQAVLDAGESETGCTIHEVTEEVDGGPIVIQKVVQVASDDTAETLKAKVQAQEGVAFVEAVAKYCTKQVISYADAGVSIDSGNELVDLIKPACKATRRPGSDADLGGFGGLFDLKAAGYDARDTVLVAGTDGVGTKLRVAQTTGNHKTIGCDLVAMCVNDVIVAGAEPLFFLDYFASGKLNVGEAADVVKGIADGCLQAGCGLIGGETAEMPSMYAPGHYDLAGFCVGAVHRNAILPRDDVAVGDVLLGLPSSGVHSNGFSLVRKLLEKQGLGYDTRPCPWAEPGDHSSVGESLLKPTRIYVRPCRTLLQKGLVKAMAHITGGGILENVPRSLPDGIVAEISGFPTPLPLAFQWLQNTSGLDDLEMMRTFNCGVGMVIVLSPEHVDEAQTLLREAGEEIVYHLGTLKQGDAGGEQVVMTKPLS